MEKECCLQERKSMPRRIALLLAAIACAFLLLFGCIAAPAQPGNQTGAQQNQSVGGEAWKAPAPQDKASQSQAVAERTGAAVDSRNTSQQQGALKIACSLLLLPERIYAGETVEVAYNTYSSGGARFTFNCGGKETGISSGGLASGSRLCQFNQTGEIAVWIKADGTVCAQKALYVLQR